MPRFRPSRQRRTDARRQASTQQLEAAVSRIDSVGLLRATLRETARRVQAEGGMSRAELIQALGDFVDQRVTKACEKRGNSALVRRCGDRIGDVAEWVTEDLVEEILGG